MAKQNEHLFKTAAKELGQKWNTIFDRSFLVPKDYRDVSEEELKARIGNSWNEFLNSDLPALCAVLEKRSWLDSKD
jgi:hypothetical protein